MDTLGFRREPLHFETLLKYVDHVIYVHAMSIGGAGFRLREKKIKWRFLASARQLPSAGTDVHRGHYETMGQNVAVEGTLEDPNYLKRE